MPDSFAGFRVQRQKTIGEEIVSDAICPVEIEGRRARGNINNAALRIEGHPRPVVGRATVFPGVPGPGFVAKFAGVGNGVERPAKFAAAKVVRANVTRRRGQSFGVATSNNDQVLVNDSWSGQHDGLRLRAASEILPEIDAPTPSK